MFCCFCLCHVFKVYVCVSVGFFDYCGLGDGCLDLCS